MAKRKAAGKPKKSKGKKTSVSKLANKRLNKLAKQGKLRKEANKGKRKEKIALKAKNEKANGELDTRAQDADEYLHEEESDLEEDDISFYSTPGQSLGFVSSLRDSLKSDKNSSKRKPGKRKKEETDDEEAYEQLPRKLFAADSNKNMKMVLPIKTKAGVVPRMVENDEALEDDEEEADDPDNVSESHDQDPDQLEVQPPELSSVELYALRQEKLAERKSTIALIAHDVTENPEENIKKLRQLVRMLYEKDPDVLVTVRKLVIVSLMEIFKDIIPGYNIRVLTEQEKKQKMKKETINLLSHEEGLLKAYKEYLEFLEKTAAGRGKKDKNNNRYHKERTVIPEKAQEGLTELSVKCMCEMLLNHPHFNYRTNIIEVLVWYMNHPRPEVSDVVCDCVKQLFKEDKAGEITLELTRAVGRMIKTKEFRVKPKVLDTFLSLRIKEVSYTDPLEKKDKKKSNFEKLSRKERKRQKRMMLLERELSETKATTDKKKRLKLHTETIQAVFLTYFRILKKATKSVLLPTVLEGLARFAHLINVEFFDDLFSVFDELIESDVLSYRESLHCVQTAFTILSGQGSALNIDPIKFYKHLYTNLFHVHAGCTCGDIPIVLECLDVMVNKRKRQVSQQRVLSFLKRLSTLVLQQTPEGALGLLAAIRTFIVTYSYSDVLFDNEAQGSGVFLPEIDDPEYCNAQNTALWELSYLQRHYHPTVRKYAKHISHGSPSTGEGQLPPDLRKSPVSLYSQFLDEDLFSEKIPTKYKKCKHKGQVSGLLQTDLNNKCTSILTSVPDVPADNWTDKS